MLNESNIHVKEKKYKSDIGDFEITDEIVELFGDACSKSDYKKMYE